MPCAGELARGMQEGGYAVEALRRNLGSFLGGFLSERRI